MSKNVGELAMHKLLDEHEWTYQTYANEKNKICKKCVICGEIDETGDFYFVGGSTVDRMTNYGYDITDTGSAITGSTISISGTNITYTSAST